MKFILSSAIIGTVLLFASCGGKETVKKEDTSAKVESQASNGLKIAYYDQDSLKVLFRYFREQDSIITKKQLAFQNEVQRRTVDFQNYITRNEERARSGMLSENEMIQIQQTAQQKEQSLMQYQQTEGAKLEKITVEKLEVIGNKIDVYSKSYCEENDIDILLIYARGGQINYINSAMDVTKEFTTYLNQKQDDLSSELKTGE